MSKKIQPKLGRPRMLNGGKSLAIRLDDTDVARIETWRRRTGRYIPQGTAVREMIRELVP